MNIVNESNLGNIKSVFNDTASNSHYYKIINKTFHGIIKNLEFAKPVIQINKGLIVWQTTAEGPYHSYTSLDSESKKHIDTLIKDSLTEMKLIIGENNDSDFLEDIIEIPNEESIFYTKEAAGSLKIILTEWGFLKDEHIKREGVLKKILSTSKQSLIVKFKSNKNELLEGINARISSEDLNFRDISNAQGIIKINNLKKGNTIVISSVDGNFEDVNLKVDTVDAHTIVVHRNHTLKFNIIDSNNKPVSGTDFIFRSPVFKNKLFQTDLDGSFHLKHPELEDDFQVYSSNEIELLSEVLPNQDHSYTIIYDPPIIEQDHEVSFTEDPPLEKLVALEFLNWRRKPIANKSIEIYGQNGKKSYTTDDKGFVYLDNLNTGIVYGVFMNFKNTSWKNEFTHTDKSQYSFIVKKKRFLWWWIPFFLFFLCLLLIPTQITHHYTVLDKNTKQPIPSADISSSETGLYQLQDYNDKTDSLGNLAIAYGKFKLFKQIFKKPSTDVFVSKAGYESLDAMVPLSYFKTKESIIYLNKLAVRKVPIADCNSGGDADNAGGNSIKEFDLIQGSGKFVFTYNTGTTHADIIKVYDCPKSEMTKNLPIWSINEASVLDKSLTIDFNSQIVTVEVIGGGNIQSVWEYQVECPE